MRDYLHVVDQAKGHLSVMSKAVVSGCHIYNLGIGTGFPVLQGQGPSVCHVEDHGVRLPYLQPGHRHRLPGPARSRAICRPCRRPWCQTAISTTWASAPASRSCKLAKQASGKDVPHQAVARRAGDVTTLFAESSKAVRELGWRAELALDDVCLRLAVAEPKQVRLLLTCGRLVTTTRGLN